MISEENMTIIRSHLDDLTARGLGSSTLEETENSVHDEVYGEFHKILSAWFGPETPVNTILFRLEQLNAKARLEQDA